MKPKYRIIFLGTPDFAVPSIKALAQAGMKPVLIVSQPDRPQGRKRKIIPTPTHQAGLDLDIPVFQPTKVRNKAFYETLASYEPDFLITAAYGRILTPEVLALAKIEALNIHASLLPKYRGASPVQASLIAGDKVTGVSIMRMTEGMDEGPVFAQFPYEIPDGMRADRLMDELSLLGASQIAPTLDCIVGGLKPQDQDASKASYVSLLDKNSGVIDWKEEALSLEHLVRGTYPWPGASASLDKKRFKVLQAKAYDSLENSSDEESALIERKEPGLLVSTRDKKLWIQTGRGLLALSEIQLEGSRAMETQDCAHNYKPGLIFQNGVRK